MGYIKGPPRAEKWIKIPLDGVRVGNASRA